MKRMAGMQPYFFPYLGYWQLIDAVDCFVLFDEAQYIKQGWVNRNRILKPGGGWQYIGVPVSRHPTACAIRDVAIADEPGWKTRILNQLTHYRPMAPCYAEAFGLVAFALEGGSEVSIGALNCRIIRQVAEALSIKCEIVISSEQGFDYATVASSGDYALVHARRLGAQEIVNPIDGASMLNTPGLASSGIALSALHPPVVDYPQGPAAFEPSLSIIDVLMFNGIAGTARLLSKRRISALEQPAHVASHSGAH